MAVSDAADDVDSRRVRYRMTGEGYEYLTDTDPHSGTERPVYVHRLCGIAWGVLEGLDDPNHVHHEESISWLNIEANLSAKDPRDHADHHLGRQSP